MLAVSWRGAAEEVRSVEACEYAEAGTDRVERSLVENRTQKIAEDHSGIEARFETAVVHFEIEEDHSEIEEGHFGTEVDRPGMAEVRSETGGPRFGMEVQKLALRVDPETAEVAQMVDYVCQTIQIQAVAEEIATVEVEQMAKAVAGMAIPGVHTVGEMTSRLNY